MYKDAPRYARTAQCTATRSRRWDFESKTAPCLSPAPGKLRIFPASAIPEPLVQRHQAARGGDQRAARPGIPVCFVLLAHWAAAYQFICLPSSSPEKLDLAQIIPHLLFPDLWFKVLIFSLIQIPPPQSSRNRNNQQGTSLIIEPVKEVSHTTHLMMPGGDLMGKRELDDPRARVETEARDVL